MTGRASSGPEPVTIAIAIGDDGDCRWVLEKGWGVSPWLPGSVPERAGPEPVIMLRDAGGRDEGFPARLPAVAPAKLTPGHADLEDSSGAVHRFLFGAARGDVRTVCWLAPRQPVAASATLAIPAEESFRAFVIPLGGRGGPAELVSVGSDGELLERAGWSR